MKFYTFATTILIFLSNASAGSHSITNAGADFKIFLESSKNSTKDQKHFDWTTFEEKYSDIYSEVVFSNASPSWFQNKTTSLDQLFDTLPKIQDEMLELFDNANQIIESNFLRFQRVVPKINQRVNFIVIPSVFKFNGMEMILPKRGGDVILLGVDSIVSRGDDIETLLSHELFHLYHFQIIDGISSYTSITSRLWTEGFATYVSSLVNPNKDDGTILFDADLGNSCSNKVYVSKLAKEFRGLIYRTLIDREKEELTREWFLLGGKSLPNRQGYCLGLQVVRKLAEKYSLEEMSHWGEMTYEDKVYSALKELI